MTLVVASHLLGQQRVVVKEEYLMTAKYDYEKYEGMDPWIYELSNEPEFFGIHSVDGRIEIDVSRYIDACKLVGIDEFLPEALKEKKEGYYIPTKVKHGDYMVNIYHDSIAELISDWNKEYKPLFEKIKTPKQVREGYRNEQICYTSCSDDYDEINFEAMLAAMKRQGKYEEIIKKFYCMFISKICTEIDRIALLVMYKSGYTDSDFSFKQFRAYSEGLLAGNDHFKIENLEKYNAYNMLHKMNNFLKHNSIDSYNTLKKFYPNNVASIENKTSDCEYENGMFAADWIIIKPNYIDDVLKKIRIFFDDYCEKFYKENLSYASWDYDDYFKYAVRQMSFPRDYFGI